MSAQPAAPPPYSEIGNNPVPYPHEEKGQIPPPAGYHAQPPAPPPPGPPGLGYPAQQGYAPAPPPGPSPYAGQQQAMGFNNTTVVMTQPVGTTILAQQFREAPVRTVCPHCRADVLTSTFFEVGTMAWLACLGLCVVGCNLGCCFIPFCIDACKDVIHSCPNCKQVISRYNRM